MPVYTQDTAHKATKLVADNYQQALASTQDRATRQQKGIDLIDSSGRLIAQVAPESSQTIVSTWVKR